MSAPFLIGAAAAAMLFAFWLLAWLVGDLLAGPVPAAVRARQDPRRR